MEGRLKLGVDIGGTFTDVMLIQPDGALCIGKVLTTPQDPSKAVVEGLSTLLQELGIPPAAIGTAIHGTTLVTNAIIERKGAKTGLITTRGFRDALEIGREMRYDIYDIFLELPKPLVPRYLRKEITERLNHDGSVVISPRREEITAVVEELRREGVEAIAVSLLHSFRNPAHERLVREVISSVDPALYVSLSSDVVPEIREYERTSTTVANVYVQPLMQRYLEKLLQELQELGLRTNLYIMLSNGGITTCKTAGEFPIRLIESGPSAGALAAAFYGELTGTEHVMSFDMGGTTAKTCLIDHGQPMTTTEFETARVYRFKKGSGLPIKVPVIEMIEIGAGGGSIAHIDKLGLLKVGPESAGASPGPVCYDQGGEEPTVTDADLILGYLDPDYFLGGKMRLNLEKAREAIEKKIASPLGVDLTRAAWGIHQVVNENMANAARIHAIERGKDPRTYTLIAFGGAGPVHAFRVAEKLRIKRVILPYAAGATSALGLLVAPPAFDFVRTYMSSLSGLDFSVVNAIFAEMEQQGRALLQEAGVAEEDIQLLRTADMRYVGQGYEIVVPIPSRSLSSQDLPVLREAFDRVYENLYHRLNPDVEVEVLNWRVRALGPKPTIALKTAVPQDIPLSEAVKGKRKAYFPEMEDYIDCPVYDRYRLSAGVSLQGPAIIEERESTAVIGPHATVRVDQYNNVIVDL
ncbi:MAG: hydantoinase/oxoprolinase family protein [Nitrospinota bacterium]|nr:MAG: hydantoinase/oxoprolinase family protein [Nitrospinota bacterium]